MISISWIIYISIVTLFLIVWLTFMFKRKHKPKETEEEYYARLEELKKEMELHKPQPKPEPKPEPVKKVESKKQSKKKVKPTVEVVEENELQPIHEDIVIKKKSSMSMARWKQWWVKRKQPHKAILVNIELLNGNVRTFIAKEIGETIKYQDKTFILDNENKYYNIDLKLWCYDYHEQYTLPIRRYLPIKDIKDQLESDPNIEVEYASNPTTLKQFIVSKIVEGIMKGRAIDKALRTLTIISTIGALAVVVHLVLFMQKSGMLDSITGSIGI